MKPAKFLRILSITLILSLLLIVIPAMPALAYTWDTTIDPDEGAIGDEITITGDDFSYSTDLNEKWVRIYFAKDEANEGDNIDDEVDTYEHVDSEQVGYEDESDEGEFETTFTVPESLTDGDDEEDVTPGTYYIYTTMTYSTGPTTIIRSVNEYTVIGGEISEIDPEEGPVDTLVNITGSDFAGSTTITIEFDGDEVDIEEGAKTASDGDLDSSFYIPESIAGDHTITVSVGSNSEEIEFTVEADIIISPQSGEAGTEVTVSGTGFDRREDVKIWFNDNIGVITDTTDSTGSFTAKFDVPADLEASIYDVAAEDGTNVANANFTYNVTPASPPPPDPATPPPPATPIPSPTQLTINTSGNNIGAFIGIGGASFIPNGTVTLKYDDLVVDTVTVATNGTFMSTFDAPPSKYGEHTITASDGTNSNTVNFTVESIAPLTPMPLLPAMGVKVESPATFDWEDVTDNSLPVTYVLLIATADDFAADSIALEKTGISESEYVLTEEEVLELEGQKTPYYWRVQAVDAASNQGAWTGTGEFYMPAPFSFPSWALYTLIGIGAVLIFGIGYWIGRRTAFYY
ncbi:IPT/TIG domain-containing protein [Chloroflexota bacterium]